MGLVVLVAGALLTYLHFTGQLTRGLMMKVGAGALGVAALIAMIKTAWLPAIAFGLGAMLWMQWNRKSKTPKLGADEARGVLGVAPGADADMIRAAHRRLVSQVHPDRGGSADLTARVNAARDILLDQLKQPRV